MFVEQAKVYELVVRHFFACCSADAKGHQTQVRVSLAREEFSATGVCVLERNWYDVYKYEHWNGNTIPVYTVGHAFEPTELYMNVRCPRDAWHNSFNTRARAGG
jgi:DNA topoisomerase-3